MFEWCGLEEGDLDRGSLQAEGLHWERRLPKPKREWWFSEAATLDQRVGMRAHRKGFIK